MISLANYDFQWARSELVIIYPDVYGYGYIGYINVYNLSKLYNPNKK